MSYYLELSGAKVSKIILTTKYFSKNFCNFAAPYLLLYIWSIRKPTV